MIQVRYVEDCSSKIKNFKTIEVANQFVVDFLLKHQGININGNWIDSIFEGKNIFLDHSIEVINEPIGTKLTKKS